MGSEWNMYAKEIGNNLNAISEAMLKEIGQVIGTIKPIYISESGVGGFGILYGNIFGMILAHILLAIIAISAIVGFFVIVVWLFGRRKKKMDPHEKWLKTGKID